MNTVAHARAILDALTDAGLTVGDHQRPATIPANPSDAAWARYSVLYFLPGGQVSGTALNPDEDFDGRFQISSFGSNASEARWQSDAANAALLVGFTVAGRSVQRIRPIDATPQMLRDDDVSPPIHQAVRRYGFWSFPN